jgi:streptogramin lyase
MFESFRAKFRQRRQEHHRLFLEELEGRCLLSHQITATGGITAAPDGSIWFLEQDRLGRVDPNSGVIQEYAIGTPMNAGGPITAGSDGSIWFLSDNQVVRFDPGTDAMNKFSVSGTLMGLSMAVAPDGDVWVGERQQRTSWDLVRIHPETGMVQEYAMGGAAMGTVIGENMIAIAGDGSVWASSGWTPVGWVNLDVLNPATGGIQQYSGGFPLTGIQKLSNGQMVLVQGSQQFGGLDGSDWNVPSSELLKQYKIVDSLNQKYPERGFVVNGPYWEDSSGNLWCTAPSWNLANAGFDMQSICEVNPTTGEATYFHAPGWVTSMTPDSTGNIWYTTPSFVGRLNTATGKSETFGLAVDVPASSSNNPPAEGGQTINATAGIDFTTAVATFTPQTPIPISGAAYQATIDWGDGSTSTLILSLTENGTYDVTAGHKYQSAGNYSIKVTIGNYNPSNPLGDNPVTVFSTANVDPFESIFMPMA